MSEVNMPTDSFWAGVGTSIQHASGEIVIAALVIASLVFAYVKFYLPEKVKDKNAERDIELKKFELDKERQSAELDIQRQRGETQARQIEISNNQTEILRQVLSILQSVQTTQKVIVAQLNDSKSNSRAMGKVIELVQDDIGHIKTKVDDIHNVIFTDTKIGGSS